MQKHLREQGQPVAEVLRRMPAPETLVRYPHQEAVDEFDRIVMSRDDIPDRTKYILAARAGVATGIPMSYADIGRSLASEFGYGITRQGVDFVLARAESKFSREDWIALCRHFPALGYRVAATTANPELAQKRAMREFRRYIKSDDVRGVSYPETFRKFGLEIPEHRAGKSIRGAAAARAIYEDYGITHCGEYRICYHCKKPVLELELYRRGSGSLTHRCKECNRAMAREFYARHGKPSRRLE